jgi:hypothetical protein
MGHLSVQLLDEKIIIADNLIQVHKFAINRIGYKRKDHN